MAGNIAPNAGPETPFVVDPKTGQLMLRAARGTGAELKSCHKCSHLKPRDGFSPSVWVRHYRWCKACHATYQRAHYKERTAKAKALKSKRLKRAQCANMRERKAEKREAHRKDEDAIIRAAVKDTVVKRPALKKDDPLNPSHYKRPGEMETIDKIRERLSFAQFEGFCRGNVIKYTDRAGAKGNNTMSVDLGKAAWYASWVEGVDPRTK